MKKQDKLDKIQKSNNIFAIVNFIFISFLFLVAQANRLHDSLVNITNSYILNTIILNVFLLLMIFGFNWLYLSNIKAGFRKYIKSLGFNENENENEKRERRRKL